MQRAGNLSALLGSEENNFATVMDRWRHSAKFAPVSCHLNKKQFISFIIWLTVIWHATDFLQLADYHSTSLNLYLAPTGRHKLLAFDFLFFRAHLILKYK